MTFKNWTRVSLITAITLVGLVILFSVEGNSTLTAQSEAAFVRHVRDFDVDNVGNLNPAGLTYSPGVNEFLVLEGLDPPPAYSDFIRLTPIEELRGFSRITASIKNPINITFDGKFQRLLFFRSAKSNLFEVRLNAEGNLDPTSLKPYNVHLTGLQEPQGMVVDPSSGDLFVLDVSGPQLIRIIPNAQGNFNGAEFTEIDLRQIGLLDPRGLSLDPMTGNLHLMSTGLNELFELTKAGEVVAIRNLSDFEITNSQGMVFAPSGDLTDEPEQMNLYLVDGAEIVGTSAVQMDSVKVQNVGRLIELSFVQPAAVAEPSFVASLEQIVNTSNLSPPSPDPAGITYLPATNSLLFSDSEVNEMPIYAGANLFEIELSGTLVNTSTTLSPVILDGELKNLGFTKEPTGVSFNPINGHFFISDDDKKDIYEVNPGLDGNIHTFADNSVTSFDSTAYNDADPEGIAYGQWQGDLFIVDGVNSEVYHLTPGVNGIFDGVPPEGDDPVTSFDTAIHGLLDPEGIAFNSDNGNLYIVGKPADRLFEVTVDGALVQTIDISAANADKPAGLAYGPSSNNPSVMSIYIVDRGVDNNTDPNENDGKLYEMSLPYSVGNHPPFVNAGPDQMINYSEPAFLDGTVTDDGLPVPPALTTLWSKDSGPGDVTFADDTMVDTSASFSMSGVYTLRLTANDGQLNASDVVIITVNPDPSTNQAPGVDAGLDQSITIADEALLAGLVTDDGLPNPPKALTSSWSKLSGPGAVSFANSKEILTFATFSDPGTYTLRLTVSDGELVNSDDVNIIVSAAPSHTIRVPQDYPTIQSAIDAAQVGDLVLVSPGTYVENLYVAKTITLASTYYTTGDESLIDQTVISSTDAELETIVISSEAGLETKVVGFTIRDGKDGIKIRGIAKILNNHLINLATDAVDLSSEAVALMKHNVMENNGDDGVDIDDAAAIIWGNFIQTNIGDGIEIRAYNISGPIMAIIIRENMITANSQDGIQLIDNDEIGVTSTKIIIQRNLIANNLQAGFGLMDSSVTSEDYRAASLLERIHLFNNTFVGNYYGVTGGDNLLALNNIFVDHPNAAVKNIDGDSLVSYNLFWNNGTDNQDSNLDLSHTLFTDPRLDPEYNLQYGSPAIDAGTALFVLASGEIVLDIAPGEFFGAAPDLGKYESNLATGNLPPSVDAGADQSITLPTLQVNLLGMVTDDGNPDPPGVTTSTWSQVSGTPGVVFGNPSALETTATFPGSGVYGLRLTASDSEWVTSDEMAVTVIDPAPQIIDIRVATSSDDAEERATGSVSLSSTDLELTFDKDQQTVGLRFSGVAIPSGANITKATIQFKTDETNTEATALTFRGQAIDNAPTFTSATFNITSRIKTAAAVSWTPAPWTIKGEIGPNQQSPDLKAIVQEIVDRPGWLSGNSLVMIISGSGKRVAESYDRLSTGAPLLHVEYFVGPTNNPPAAENDTANTAEDTPVIINVAANDTDPEGNLDPTSANTSCATCSLPANGTLANNGNGSFTYRPDTNFNGPDGFVYEICDTSDACDTAAVSIVVVPTPDPPVANDDEAITQEDVPVTVDVAANDTDPDGNLDPASANTNCPTCAKPASGTLINNANGTFNYSPNLGFNGTDGFVYEICDTGGLCDNAAVDLTVTPSNDPPVANDDNAETLEDTPVMIDVAANDDDSDGNLDPSSANTTCATCSEPGHGTLLNHEDGTFDYEPLLNFNGSDSFVYEICDTFGACATATVFLTVTPVADPPIANNDSASTLENTAVTIDVVANDTDVDGDLNPASTNTTCPNCAGPADGSLVNTGNGTFRYTPDPTFYGADNFIYEVCDSGSPALCDTAVVSITINSAGPITVEVRVAASTDDAEERATGKVSLNSTDLELTFDKDDQTVGMRFAEVLIPPKATITKAYIQFQVDEVSSEATALTIQGEASDNAPTFTRNTNDITSRTKTPITVPWAPVPWTTKGAAGPDQRTPEIAGIIQAIINREGWISGNSIVIIISGTGKRVAETFDGDSTGASLLHIEYTSN